MLATLWSDADAAASTGETPVGALVSTGSEVLILTAANGGVIQECSVTGCNQSPVTIVATGLDNANNTGSAGLLALGGNWAYWPGQAAVKDVTSATSTISVFAEPANASVYAVATNATRVFWSDLNLGILSCAFGATCASPSTLVPKASLAAAPQVLAADESYVYWMDANGNLLSSTVAGASPVSLEGDDAGAGFNPMAMVAQGGRVYYVDAASGELMTATGGAASSATVYSTDTPTAIATDGVNLYWGGSNGIMKCALGAACATPTEIYGATVSALAVDANNMYWIDTGTNNSFQFPTFGNITSSPPATSQLSTRATGEHHERLCSTVRSTLQWGADSGVQYVRLYHALPPRRMRLGARFRGVRLHGRQRFLRLEQWGRLQRFDWGWRA